MFNHRGCLVTKIDNGFIVLGEFAANMNEVDVIIDAALVGLYHSIQFMS